MKRKIILCFILAVAVCALISGCGANDNNEPQSDQTNEIEQDNNTMKDCIVVNTEFGDLYYPDQWTECVRINQSATENALTVSFDAAINDNEYPLFEIVIGEDAGTEVGELTETSGIKHKVYLHVKEIEEDPSLTDGEQNRLYAMQEDLNYLIENLK